MKLQHKLNPEVTNSPKRLLFPCSGAADQDIEPGLEANSKKTQVPRKHKFQILEFLKVIYWSCFEILRQFEILFHHLDSEIVCPSVSLLSFWTCVAGVAYVWRVRAGWLFQLQKVKWTGRRTVRLGGETGQERDSVLRVCCRGAGGWRQGVAERVCGQGSYWGP